MDKKTVLGVVGVFIMIIGGIIGAISSITSIGYALYQWHLGVVLSTALWTAFILWVKMIGTAFLSFIIGFVLMVIGEK